MTSDEMVLWLAKEAVECKSWTEFQTRTEHGTIEWAKKDDDWTRWQENPLVELQAAFLQYVIDMKG